MTRSRRALAFGSVAVVLALAAVAGWWFLVRSDAPPPVDLAAAVSTLAEQAPTTTTTTTGATTLAEQAPATTQLEQAATAADSWEVDADGGSFVGYRVREELASIGATTAVGRTPDVAGTLTIDGAAVTTVAVEADLRSLESDDSRRDRALRSQALETDAFPNASFVLTSPIPLDAEPAEGQEFSGVASGDLTLRGVTRQVEVPIEGQLANGAIVVVGSLPVEFADYGIDSPSSFVVLSVEDNGVVEFQLVFRPA